jgi:hypothetical protein
MCKHPNYLAIVKHAAIDCRGRREEESKWGNSFCFYDIWLKGKRALYANGEGRGILICPGVEKPVITPWTIAICCRAAAENLMLYRAGES